MKLFRFLEFSLGLICCFASDQLFSYAQLARGQKFMVVSAHADATQVGFTVLKRGGNACDAAIAVSLALSVVRPQSTGLGGGGFLLHYDPKRKKTIALDFRERAPLKAHKDMYVQAGQLNMKASKIGYLAPGVPGLLAGLDTLYKQCGSLPWVSLVKPAITLAAKGFRTYPAFNAAVIRMRSYFDASMKKTFLKSRIIQRDLARTLKIISLQGAKSFYSGQVAVELVAAMEKNRGIVTRKDLAAYKVKTRPVITGSFRGYTIVSMPPPSSGGVHIVQMLKALEPFEMHKWGPNHWQTKYLVIEAMRHAFYDRAHHLGDPDFWKVPVTRLVSQAHAQEFQKNVKQGKPKVLKLLKMNLQIKNESADTTHFSIIDKDGRMIASTQTINGPFGAAVSAGRTGIILNNEMDDFTTQPGSKNMYGLVGHEANAIAPQKTPLSSMSPTFVFKKDRPLMVLGSPGGPRIISAVFQTLLNVLIFDMSLKQALASPRLHAQWRPESIYYESLPNNVLRKLRSLGYRLTSKKPRFFGDVQAIFLNETGTILGCSDPRDKGLPKGE